MLTQRAFHAHPALGAVLLVLGSMSEPPPLLPDSRWPGDDVVGQRGDARMPRRFQRPYPEEFRREAVRLVEVSGRPVAQVAGGLGVSGEGLRKWVKQAQADRGERPAAPARDELEELRLLRRRVRELEA